MFTNEIKEIDMSSEKAFLPPGVLAGGFIS
jgi:hypothetical protein